MARAYTWPHVGRCRLRSRRHHRPTNTGCGATSPNGLAEDAPARGWSVSATATFSLCYFKPLGQWVLDQACKQMKAWREAGIAPQILAINLSLGQLRTGDEFVDSITQTLTEWGLTPSDLELDVTESMLAHVTLHKNSLLDQLQQLGVKIAIDDFGTQYSSLDYLKTYRVSRVKISRLMLDAAMRDPGESAMVRAIIGVARELDIEVIAQGVETEAQRDLLTCVPSTTKVQGFYYSAPVPVVHATELLRQRLIEPRLSQVSDATAAQ